MYEFRDYETEETLESYNTLNAGIPYFTLKALIWLGPEELFSQRFAKLIFNKKICVQ